MATQKYFSETLLFDRQDTETWISTYQFEQRDATATISAPISLFSAAISALLAPAPVRGISVSFFVLVAMVNFSWLVWRKFSNGPLSQSVLQSILIADQMILVGGAAGMMLLGAHDGSLNVSHKMIGWILYFVLGFQICDSVRSTPFLATVGALLHSTVAMITWRLADHDEFAAATILFVFADTYVLFHSIIRLDQIKGQARLSIEQSIGRESSERSRRESIESDLKKARSIQSALTQHKNVSDTGVLELNCYHRPFDILGGDWYASRTRADGRIVVVVADVSGKGVAAAMVSQTVQSIWAQALDTESFDPIEWMSNVNKTLITMGQGQLYTMTMGLMVVSGHEVQYYCAGHLPIYLIQNADQKPEVKAFYGRGNILGVGPLDVQPVTVPLPKSEEFTVMMGTDGVLDWRTRRNPRAMLNILKGLRTFGEASLELSEVADDKILVTVGPSSVVA